jgi:hypothetical protein
MVRALALTALLLIAPAGFATPVKPLALTPAQRQSLRPVWVAFAKLKAATEVGTTPSGYSDRLIDLKAALDPPLAKLPPGPVKRHLCRAILTYLDAFTIWSDAGSSPYKQVFKGTAGYRRVREYGLPWRNGAEFDRVTDADYEPWLRVLWTKAAAYAEEAQSLAAGS